MSDQEKKTWADDTCPVCESPAVSACRCPLNDRKCENGHWWRRRPEGLTFVLDGPHGSPVSIVPANKNKVKNLTSYPGDFTTDDLWNIVAEACRKNSFTWRAYERLRTRIKYGQRIL